MAKGCTDFLSLYNFIEKQVFDVNLDTYLDELYPYEYIDDAKLLPHQFYYIINVVNSECVYVSPHLKDVLGYSIEEWKMTFLLEAIHPEDRWFVAKALEAGYKAGQTPSFKIRMDASLVMNYRIKHKSGSYVHILRYGTRIKNDKLGNMVYIQSLCTDITELKKDNRMICQICKGDEVLFEMHSSEPEVDLKVLSNREREIVECLCENLTSDVIASRLHVSKHTVDTHRRNILKKLNMRNTIELLIKLNR